MSGCTVRNKKKQYIIFNSNDNTKYVKKQEDKKQKQKTKAKQQKTVDINFSVHDACVIL